jgi:hypothetical protein
MYSMKILKAHGGLLPGMSQELDGKQKAREPLNEEEKAALRAKATSYALLNRPSPPF